MFARRRAFVLATRLPVTRSRAITPFARYSTEAASIQPATSTPPASPPTETTASPSAPPPSTTTPPSTASETPPAPSKKAPSAKATSSTPAPSRSTFSSRASTAKQVPTSKPRAKPSALKLTPPTYASQASQNAQPPADKPSKDLKEIKQQKPTSKLSEYSHPVFDAPAGLGNALDVLSINDINWEKSYYGAGVSPVTKEQFNILTREVKANEIEVKPDGVLYLPEIRYRRRLNEAFGPMGWSLIPRGEAVVGESIVTREYALIVNGRFVSQAQGENNYFGADQLPSAVEGCKSNALMRCCKDLGIASELWDPLFLRWFKKSFLQEVWVEHVTTKKKRTFWYRKGDVQVGYPWKLAQ